jgi:hypothetical protein
MRWGLFMGVVCLGALLGVAAALHDDTATQVGMAFVGALFAAPVAAVLARRRESIAGAVEADESIEPAGSCSPRALARNYWRDRGHPPFMKPSDSDPDKHMFDPDRIS